MSRRPELDRKITRFALFCVPLHLDAGQTRQEGFGVALL
jgi:hypothetical protein